MHLWQQQGWARPYDADGKEELNRLQAQEPYMWMTESVDLGHNIPMKDPEQEQNIWYEVTD